MDQESTWYGVGLGRGNIVLDGDPASPTQKGHSPPQFSAHVYCGQTACWINIPLDTGVGLRPSDIVLDGEPPPPKKGHSPQIFGSCLLWANSWMGQDAT